MNTKNQLISKVPTVRFSGKTKTVFINSNRFDYPATQYLTEFCLLTGYKYQVVYFNSC
jgi:hypothetical protein